MSFFNKVLSSVGIGAAKIDTVLDSSEAYPGQEITGSVQITGGKSEQTINKINLHLMCNYMGEVEVTRHEDGESITETETQELEYRMANYQVADKFVVEAGEDKTIEFSFILPECAPLSIGHTNTWISSHLDIAMAIDKKDRDYVKVVGNPLQQALFDAVGSLGFQLVEAECEGAEQMQFNGAPYVQELEFKPTTGDYRGKLDELELVTMVRGEQLEVMLEIDRKARGLGGFFREMMDRDETNVRLVIGHDDIEHLADIIDEVLQKHS